MVGEKMTFKVEIEKLLKTELKVLEALRDISFEKTDIIVKNEITRIQEITAQEEKLSNMIKTLEKERQILFDTWGIAKDTPISLVIDNLPEDARLLTDIKEDMSGVIEELGERNTLNNDLIKENLDWIDFNMNLITSIDSNPSYGDEKKNRSINIFDKKV